MNNQKYSDFDKMGKIRKEVKKAKHSKSSGPQKVTPGAAQGLVFNTSGYGQHILKNPQVVQSMVEKAGVFIENSPIFVTKTDTFCRWYRRKLKILIRHPTNRYDT